MALIFDPSKKDSCLNSYREVFSDSLKSGDGNTYNSGVILPLDFTLEMDGISGLIPHSAFIIPSEALPKPYIVQSGPDAGKQRIAFILHSIEQNFNNNKWTTKLTGQTLNIRFEPLTDAEKKSIQDAQTNQESLRNFANRVQTREVVTPVDKNKEISTQSSVTQKVGVKTSLKNYIIGDSQTPFIDTNSKKAARINTVSGPSSLWKGGENLKWLKNAVDAYPISNDVTGIIINIGTNGGFNPKDNISGLVSSIKQKFPNATLLAVKGSWGWGGNINVTEEKVNIYYNKFKALGVEIIEPAIGKVKDPHGNLPVYKQIGNNIDRKL